jgi:hypothetical protein
MTTSPVQHLTTLTEVAQLARRIYATVHPTELTEHEASQLRGVLTAICDRIDQDRDTTVDYSRGLRLVKEHDSGPS